MLQYINDMNIHADFPWRYPPKQHIYKPHLQAGIVTDWMMDRCSTGCWTVQTLTTTWIIWSKRLPNNGIISEIKMVKVSGSIILNFDPKPQSAFLQVNTLQSIWQLPSLGRLLTGSNLSPKSQATMYKEITSIWMWVLSLDQDICKATSYSCGFF